MRFLVLICIVALLAGCEKKDEVVDPLRADHDLIGGLVTPADAPLREGLWNGSNDETCPFDPGLAGPAWPDCARWWLIEGGKIRFGYGPVSVGDGSDGSAYAYRDGQPGVLQTEGLGVFDFDLVWPTATDDEGRIIAVYRQGVSCQDLGQASDSANAVNAPPLVPGAVRDGSGQCIAPDVGVLVSAQAIAGPAQPGPANLRFVRDKP